MAKGRLLTVKYPVHAKRLHIWLTRVLGARQHVTFDSVPTGDSVPLLRGATRVVTVEGDHEKERFIPIISSSKVPAMTKIDDGIPECEVPQLSKYGTPECTGMLTASAKAAKRSMLGRFIGWYDRNLSHPVYFFFLVCVSLACIVFIVDTAAMMEAATGNCPDFTKSTEPGSFQGRRMSSADKPKINDPSTPNLLMIVVDDLRYDAPWLADAPNYRYGCLLYRLKKSVAF